MKPGLTPGSMLSRTTLHAFSKSVSQLKNEARQTLDCSWNPTKSSQRVVTCPLRCRTKVDQRAQNPSIPALILFPLSTGQPSSPPVIFPFKTKTFLLSGPINSQEACPSTLGVPGPLADSRRDNAKSACSRGSGNRWARLLVHWGKLETVFSVCTLNTPDLGVFQEKQLVGGKRKESKEVAWDSTLRGKFPLSTTVSPQLTPVKDSVFPGRFSSSCPYNYLPKFGKTE